LRFTVRARFVVAAVTCRITVCSSATQPYSDSGGSEAASRRRVIFITDAVRRTAAPAAATMRPADVRGAAGSRVALGMACGMLSAPLACAAGSGACCSGGACSSGGASNEGGSGDGSREGASATSDSAASGGCGCEDGGRCGADADTVCAPPAPAACAACAASMCRTVTPATPSSGLAFAMAAALASLDLASTVTNSLCSARRCSVVMLSVVIVSGSKPPGADCPSSTARCTSERSQAQSRFHAASSGTWPFRSA
jgi:hypothetical protein